MGTLTALFNNTRNTLLADQTAITATANNIANQNSTNYTRRTVTFTQNDTVQINGPAASTGVTATVTASRDRILDRAVQQATDTASSSSSRLTALTQLQGIFSIGTTGEDSTGIQSAISGFFSSVSAIAADPTSAAARQTTLSAAQTLAAAFNRTSAQIATQTASLNQQVSTSVTQVNTLLQGIADKNNAITNSVPGSDTSSLEDDRTDLLNQLSSLVGLHQTTTESGSITVSTTNGTVLVGGSQAFPLTTTNTGGTTRVLAATSLGGADITAALTGGALAGAIHARDTDLPAVTSQLDTLAYAFATAVNTQNEAGTDTSGNAGTAVFSVGTSAAGAAAAIATTLASGSSFAASSSGTGAGSNSNANAMLALQNASTVNGQTFSSAYSTLLSGLGTTVSAATTNSSADAAIQTQLSTQRDTVSGISLDEEASNLTQYQRSYQAAAKLLSILNDLLGSAINLGTTTTVS